MTLSSNHKKMISKKYFIIFIIVLITISLTQSNNVFAIGVDYGVPISTGRDYNHVKDNLKNFTLDALASKVAKQLLHQLTTSVVDWINSGYEGNPSFLTNPTGFFIDTADQISGQFISESGPLSGLCGPFNLNLRLNLALGDTTYINQRYACTLSTIINNAKNARVDASVGVSPDGMNIGDIISGDVANNPNAINVNGASINDTGDFLSGNFGNGGWPAFVALTTEPQNNEYGAYIMARNDLSVQIAERQQEFNSDLDRGNGFLSWKKCETLKTVDTEIESQVRDAEARYANDPTIKRKTNSDGTIEYQSCTTQTPGSILAGTLQTNLDSSVVQLEMANDINTVVNAAMTQLMNSMISKGLGTLSNGGESSETHTLLSEQNRIYEEQISSSQIQMTQELSESAIDVRKYKETLDKILPIANQAFTILENASACYKNKTATTDPTMADYNDIQIAKIKSTITNETEPLIAELNKKITEANNMLKTIDSLKDNFATKITSTQDARNEVDKYSEAVRTALEINSDVEGKQQEAEALMKKAEDLKRKASSFENACS